MKQINEYMCNAHTHNGTYVTYTLHQSKDVKRKKNYTRQPAATVRAAAASAIHKYLIYVCVCARERMNVIM